MAGFYQEAVDHIARQGFANAQFEVNSEEGIGGLEEFFSDGYEEEQSDDSIEVMSIQKSLKNSYKQLN